MPAFAVRTEDMEEKKPEKEKLRLKTLPVVLMLALFILFCVSGSMLLKDLRSNRRDKQGFEELSAIVEASAAFTPAPTATPGPETAEEPAEEEPDSGPLQKYAQLHEMNPEFFGWLTAEGVGIDYPVMYSPTRAQYYLNRDFYGAYSDSGIPFIDERCPENGNYYLIYGHLMVNKSIFGRLPEYADPAVWQAYPTIRFDTVYEEREYAVMAAFYTRLLLPEEWGFRYYEYYDLTNEAVFNEYVANVLALRIYDTGVTAQYGDELLVLSTCSHHTDDGRFVLVAKRIR